MVLGYGLSASSREEEEEEGEKKAFAAMGGWVLPVVHVQFMGSRVAQP